MRFLILLLATLVMAADCLAANPVETGRLEGAAYRIDVPPDWNRELVVYFHGYSIAPVEFAKDGKLFRPLEQIVARGYAVMQSGYSRTGWAVEQAVADTERLRKFFIRSHGKPKRSLVVGMSMGGLLTVHALETQPTIYAGGLALCGAIAPADVLAEKAFANRAAFDHYFPGLLGPLVPVPPNYRPDDETVRRIDAALRGNPVASTALRALQTGSLESNLPGVIAFTTAIIRELQQRTGGNPFDNRNIIYVGTGDDVALNARVARYGADAEAARYLTRWYAPTGKLERPLLALHTSGDPLVPASTAFDYALLTRRADHADRFVQQYVPAEGHCTMSPEQTAGAFDDLIAWVAEGKKPMSGLREP